jgi:hypothetical protein
MLALSHGRRSNHGAQIRGPRRPGGGLCRCPVQCPFPPSTRVVAPAVNNLLNLCDPGFAALLPPSIFPNTRQASTVLVDVPPATTTLPLTLLTLHVKPYRLLSCLPRSGPSNPQNIATMGIIEDEVKRLTGVVEGLESRIKQLEQKSFGSTTKSTEEIRMILMGPPGAGTDSQLAFCARRCRCCC